MNVSTDEEQHVTVSLYRTHDQGAYRASVEGCAEERSESTGTDLVCGLATDNRGGGHHMDLL